MSEHVPGSVAADWGTVPKTNRGNRGNRARIRHTAVGTLSPVRPGQPAGTGSLFTMIHTFWWHPSVAERSFTPGAANR